jgi:uncharacterized protein YjbI with pentapeptide repeats
VVRFIEDSLLGGYDGAQNVRDEEHPVGQKKSGRKAESASKRGIAWPRWTGFRGMTVRDWLQLLIVPFALVVISFLFTAQQDQRQQQIENQRAQQAQKIENQRAEAERQLAEQRAQDEALQGYLDQMSSLLLEKDLRTSDEGSEARTLARARTLTVLTRLDPTRKAAVMQFLAEAELIQSRDVDESEPIISLEEANLSGTDLRGVHLSNTQLRAAELRDVDLSGANLSGTALSDAELSDVKLNDAELRSADLSGANLSDTYLPLADLTGADLSDWVCPVFTDCLPLSHGTSSQSSFFVL